ncbi:SseB family protein [Kocuria sp.]|uniref:SseB family protein n=1 Tax=Kocuria sp. TaxID=1871328 RepID=UPI0026DFFBFA|nr:SseB family protein [Kocuria sp.]MDO5618719.1 SseB family protein [Kocuria sp.]
MSDPAAPGSRPLPPHIAAQLRSAGGETDTGGQPWAGRDLAHGHHHQFVDDDGAADAALARTLVEWQSGSVAETDVVAALADTRLFVPVMAEVSHSEITEDGLVADKEADMSLVTLQAADGRKAQPVFTSDRLITQWHASARPVAAQVRKIAIAAVKDGTELLVLNPGSDAPFVVRRPALWAVAKGEGWAPSYTSGEVSQAVLQSALGLDGVAGAYVRPGRGVDAVRSDSQAVAVGEFAGALRGGGSGPELTVVLQLLPGMNRERLNHVVAAFQNRLATERVVAEKVDSLEISLETARI